MPIYNRLYGEHCRDSGVKPVPGVDQLQVEDLIRHSYDKLYEVERRRDNRAYAGLVEDLEDYPEYKHGLEIEKVAIIRLIRLQRSKYGPGWSLLMMLE